jgi:hypothetical protein
MLKEALDDDFALSFSKLTKEDLLKDAVIKAEYDLASYSRRFSSWR